MLQLGRERSAHWKELCNQLRSMWVFNATADWYRILGEEREGWTCRGCFLVELRLQKTLGTCVWQLPFHIKFYTLKEWFGKTTKSCFYFMTDSNVSLSSAILWTLLSNALIEHFCCIYLNSCSDIVLFQLPPHPYSNHQKKPSSVNIWVILWS